MFLFSIKMKIENKKRLGEREMSEFKHSPVFWFVLGILWSVSVLLKVLENNCVIDISHVLLGILAIASYMRAVFCIVRRRSEKNE